jgi:hypothetical protein
VEQLHAIDALVPPGTNVVQRAIGYDPPSVTDATLRRLIGVNPACFHLGELRLFPL